MKIICLGDSFTEGFLVENRSYTRFLSKAGFEVVNLGKNGSTTGEMLERYEDYVLMADPADLLIIFGEQMTLCKATRSIWFSKT